LLDPEKIPLRGSRKCYYTVRSSAQYIVIEEKKEKVFLNCSISVMSVEWVK
jgi:hypothetical protein